MIRSHQDFLAFREADRIALRREFSSQMMFDEVWKFQRLLRPDQLHRIRKAHRLVRSG